MPIREYVTVDGVVVKVDEDKKYRMPNVNGGGVSYSEIGNMEGLIGVFQEERFRGKTVEVAGCLMGEFSIVPDSKELFVVMHSTQLFNSDIPTSPLELGTMYEELLNTKEILEQIIRG